MFERISDRARKVMAYANLEAQRFNHSQIGSEHILLGLAKEGSGIGAQVLKNLNLDLRNVRLETEKLLASEARARSTGKLPQTTAAQRVIERAIEESLRLNLTYLGTEHLLVALIMDDGIAGRVLSKLGVTVTGARDQMHTLLGYTPELDESRPPRQLPDCPMCQRLGQIQSDPSFIAEMQTSYAVLGDNQGTRGWCVLLLKEHHEHLADLPVTRQPLIFFDVARLAAAIRSVFPTSGKDGGPPRINYECLGNLVPHVHWHIIPRHADDPEPTKAVWGWSEERLRGEMSAEARGELVLKLREALKMA